MSLINRAIANLFNGISQQSPSIRQPAQAELQENAYSSIVDGLHKRHPTKHVAKLTTETTDGAFCHVINRDGAERYVVVIRNKKIDIWDMNGNVKTVNAPGGLNYLDVSNPQEDIAVVTIADYTMIVNKTKTVTRENNSASTFSSTVVKSKYSDLPSTGTSGVLYKITGTPDNAWTAYYAKWDGSTYVECTKDNVGNKLTAATMPHRLVREADGTFTFSTVDWQERLVGDDITAAPPSFVDKKITDLFFFRNRLGFLSDENVIFSRAGDYFSLFPETVTQVLDSDPVDVAVSHIKVSNLKHAIPFNKNLLLFSELSQFMLTSSDTLTPKTVAVHQTTEFECSNRVKPVAAGSNVYFAVEKTGFTAVREYYVMPYQNSFEADDVTAHVPKYLPGGVVKLVASTNEDILFALSEQERNALYVYKYYWKGEEKIQSSWSKWVFEDDSSVLSMEMMGTKLYLIIRRSDGLYLEVIDLQVGLIESDLPILVMLDRKCYLTGTYNAGTGKTTWTLPYAASAAQAVLSGDFTGKTGAPLTVTHPTAGTIEAVGDFSGGQVIIGIPYTMRYRFSAQHPRDEKGVAVAGASIKIRKMRLFYTKSGYFRTEVTPQSRDKQTYIFTGKVLGSPEAILGRNQINTGVFNFPVLSNGVTVQIDIVNDSYLPSFFQSAELEAFYVNRSQRM